MFRPTDNADNRIIEGAAVLFSPPYQTKQEELQDYRTRSTTLGQAHLKG